MIFKCETCSHWKDGEGDKTCLSCHEYKDVGSFNRLHLVSFWENVEDCPAPEFDESMWPTVAEHPVWPHLRAMKTKKATVLFQYYCLQMKPKMIARYNDIGMRQVYNYLKIRL